MPAGFRLLGSAVVTLAGLLPDPCLAQSVEVGPSRISFALDADTLLSFDNPPTRLVEIGPQFSAGTDSVRFKLRDFIIESLPANPRGEINFVIVTPSSGVAFRAAHATLSIALNPWVVPYMRSGVYSLIVRFANADAPPTAEPTAGVIVSLVLGGAGPAIASVSNAASLQPGVSPGQLVTIRGTRLSTPPLTAEPDPAGLFPKALGNTAVTFNGIVAPLLYVSNDQVNCVAPYGLAGSRTAEVIVHRVRESGSVTEGGVLRSAPVTVPVSETNPAVFTGDQSGTGAVAAINLGGAGGPNAQVNPAPKGSAIAFYATGAGLWNFPFPDGGLVLNPLAFTPATLLTQTAPVSVTIGGQPARPVQPTPTNPFAGIVAQRGGVSGMLQVQVHVPEDIGSGAQPVVVKIGDNDNSRQNVSVWVQ